MKLEEATYRDVLTALANTGSSMSKIARQVGCSPANVQGILRRHTRPRQKYQDCATRDAILVIVRRHLRRYKPPLVPSDEADATDGPGVGADVTSPSNGEPQAGAHGCG